ncbi:hypothetical protein BX666DRAFT_1895240 [Dichotomocladium elegans]|nr:hypothetical protein BX666DRAFT_1895240 [Dichotomocladium elegans]
MLACRRIVHLQRSLIHTSTPAAASGGFSRFNPWAKKAEPQEQAVNNVAAPVNTTFDVKHYEEEPDTLSWKNKDIVQEADKIQSVVRSIVVEAVAGSETNWKETRLDDANVKFKVVKESIQKLGKEVSNAQLNNMQTVEDVLDHFLRTAEHNAAKKPSVAQYFEDHADSLPPNLVFRSHK